LGALLASAPGGPIVTASGPDLVVIESRTGGLRWRVSLPAKVVAVGLADGLVTAVTADGDGRWFQASQGQPCGTAYVGPGPLRASTSSSGALAVGLAGALAFVVTDSMVRRVSGPVAAVAHGPFRVAAARPEAIEVFSRDGRLVGAVEAQARALAWWPGGGWLALHDQGLDLVRVDGRGLAPWLRAPGGQALAVSPDGALVALAFADHLALYDRQAGLVASVPLQDVGPMAFGARTTLVVMAPGGILRLDLDPDDPQPPPTDPGLTAQVVDDPRLARALKDPPPEFRPGEPAIGPFSSLWRWARGT
jgi:hypothetical protein